LTLTLTLVQDYRPWSTAGKIKRLRFPGGGPGQGPELVVPNPKVKLMDQVREVLRIKHYAIRTEQAYCDWSTRRVRHMYEPCTGHAVAWKPRRAGCVSKA
jgi:hypothetical protein